MYSTSLQLSKTIIFITALVFFTLPVSGSGQEAEKTVRIAIHECEPFVIKDETSQKGYSGLSIYLVDQIAQKINFDYTLVPYTLQGMLDAVKNEEVTLGVSCTSITPEREEYIDFSHSFFETNLAIASRKKNPLANAIAFFLNVQFLKAIGVILAISVFISVLLWFFEHKTNRKLYTANHRAAKIIEAMLPGLLSITQGPPSYWNLSTVPGRVLVVIGAMSSTFIVAGITAMIAAVITTQQLKGQINGPQDLHKVIVGSLQNSTSASYLDKIQVPYNGYNSVKTMLSDLESRKIDAIVEDAPVLKYLIKQGHQAGKYLGITVLPTEFNKQNYAMILPDDHPKQEKFNRLLLEVRRQDKWAALQDKYFRE